MSLKESTHFLKSPSSTTPNVFSSSVGHIALEISYPFTEVTYKKYGKMKIKKSGSFVVSMVTYLL
jgi:hypothetical protein